MLKDGSEVVDRRLDRLYEEDWNSLNYPVTAKPSLANLETRTPVSKTWPIDITLDQGSEGACVGFAFAHDAIAEPEVVRVHGGYTVDATFAKNRIYYNAQGIDEWPGGSYPGASPVYEGTSVLAGAKIMTQMGLYTGYYWGLDLMQCVLGLGYDGPAILGIPWHEGMYTPDANGFIHATGKVIGGHAILAYGVDVERKFIKLHNSWGPGWGEGGNCKLSFADFEKLLNSQGDACFPKRVPVASPVVPEPPKPEPEVVVTNTYRTRVETVEAVRWSGSFDALRNFAGAARVRQTRTTTPLQFFVDKPRKLWVGVPIGNMIVRKGDVYWVMDSNSFAAQYEAVS